ncbi:hypothetical protein K6U06_23960 [Acidiferrimicrobium sp. IK]|uniref:hypothetical protein n=1 Tax=Acidiferrimicrobium sp. IK TaxID=2871700 RepID=UPI0021CB4179|nr:hypothetical protein [Acidiferrimicrobium sp. IK]MCU4187434.1 hypothetical protein [Acidiferrimicrobium sp. IK]
MSLQETAARLGGHQWMEQAVWKVLGAWGASTGDPAAAVLLDTHAQHAAWRAQQWWERLPVLAVIERDALVRPPSGAIAGLVEQLATAGPDATVARMAAAYRVLLARLLAGYSREAHLLSPVSDGPARRTLAQAESDASADWRAGESFLQRLLTDASAVDQAASTVADLERLLALRDPAGEAVQ